jgi:imidazolonepropionase-like amidohydrolase
MRHRLLGIAVGFAAFGGGDRALAQTPARGALARGTLAISNVTVIPMTADTALPDRTVIVRDGRIESIAPPGTARVPPGARRIDGRGKFLIPGLVDTHAHLFSDGAVPDSVAGYELGVMVANGVTATRLMMGTPEQLALRREVASGRLVGPMLWLASPEFAGRKYGDEFHGKVVATPAEARAAVQEMASAGYDFIKITLFVGPEPYAALIEEAKRRGIGVVGHVDPSVGVPRALGAGQHIEHLDNYLENVLADSAPMKGSVSDRGVYSPKAWESLDYVDDAKVARIAGLTARSGTFTTPTLTIFKNAFALGMPDSVVRAWRDWRLYPPELRAMWRAVIDRYWTNPAAAGRRHRWVATRNRLVKAIVDSGGRVMTGSDTPEFLHGYGWTLHRELASLVSAGLTPYQALTAATSTPARFLERAPDWGTIAPGNRADLVLLSGNPLLDITNTTRIDAVALGGRWLDSATLERMVTLALARLGAVAQ